MCSANNAVTRKFAPGLPDNLARLAQMEEEAGEYLRSRWPGAELSDVRGGTFLDVLSVCRQAETCANCPGEDACPVRCHPMGITEASAKGRSVYRLGVVPCRLRRARTEDERVFERLVRYSGLSEKQQKQTFDAFVTQGVSHGVMKAKALAMLAAREGLWLVLAGSRGAGKSHLATALALEVMRNGKQARFRMVSEMLDDLRAGNADGGYHEQMAWLKEVPCLVLDDLGKERGTAAGMEYLHQIVDARYREQRQTVITTNALTREELIGWGTSDFIVPLVSRLEEMGAWCSIRGEDYRAKIGKARRRANA